MNYSGLYFTLILCAYLIAVVESTQGGNQREGSAVLQQKEVEYQKAHVSDTPAVEQPLGEKGKRLTDFIHENQTNNEPHEPHYLINLTQSQGSQPQEEPRQHEHHEKVRHHLPPRHHGRHGVAGMMHHTHTNTHDMKSNIYHVNVRDERVYKKAVDIDKILLQIEEKTIHLNTRIIEKLPSFHHSDPGARPNVSILANGKISLVVLIYLLRRVDQRVDENLRAYLQYEAYSRYDNLYEMGEMQRNEFVDDPLRQDKVTNVGHHSLVFKTNPAYTDNQENNIVYKDGEELTHHFDRQSHNNPTHQDNARNMHHDRYSSHYVPGKEGSPLSNFHETKGKTVTQDVESGSKALLSKLLLLLSSIRNLFTEGVPFTIDSAETYDWWVPLFRIASVILELFGIGLFMWVCRFCYKKWYKSRRRTGLMSCDVSHKGVYPKGFKRQETLHPLASQQQIPPPVRHLGSFTNLQQSPPPIFTIYNTQNEANVELRQPHPPHLSETLNPLTLYNSQSIPTSPYKYNEKIGASVTSNNHNPSTFISSCSTQGQSASTVNAPFPTTVNATPDFPTTVNATPFQPRSKLSESQVLVHRQWRPTEHASSLDSLSMDQNLTNRMNQSQLSEPSQHSQMFHSAFD